jgi:hypothetical protein
MNEPVLQMVEANGLKFRVATQGTGPGVLLCHGFPESWYSWRRQLTALADAGYRAIAPDMRGYGQSDKPEAVSVFHVPPRRRHGWHSRCIKCGTGRCHWARLGRAGCVACSVVVTGQVQSGGWAQRTFLSARTSSTVNTHARNRCCDLLSNLFSDARRCRDRAGTRCSIDDAQHSVPVIGRLRRDIGPTTHNGSSRW